MLFEHFSDCLESGFYLFVYRLIVFNAKNTFQIIDIKLPQIPIFCIKLLFSLARNTDITRFCKIDWHKERYNQNLYPQGSSKIVRKKAV